MISNLAKIVSNRLYYEDFQLMIIIFMIDAKKFTRKLLAFEYHENSVA